jgi:hypothetical protein
MLIALIPALIVLVFMLVPVGFILFVQQRQRKQKRSPLSRDLLRSPGQSLRKRLDELNWDMAGNLIFLPMIPLMIYSIHLTQTYVLGRPESILRISISVAAGVLAWSFVFFRTYKSAHTIWKLRLGYEAELAMGQELDQLMRKGAVVFHDMPAEGFNIDHALVAPNGVFAIETKGRSKPNRNRGKGDANVIYDGKALNFPTWTESQPLEQARSQAKWLSKWLSSAVGEPVSVKPVLALPGWFVDRKGRSDVMVISGRESYSILSTRHETLSPSLIQRIEHQMDQRCRDVEPTLSAKQQEAKF